MRTSCLLSFCSYVALFVSSIYTHTIYFVFILPTAGPLVPRVALSEFGPFSKISCRALEANRFWEVERESLSKWRLQLGEGQRTEVCLAPVHPNCRSRMHLLHNTLRKYCTDLEELSTVQKTRKNEGGKKRGREKHLVWYKTWNITLKNSLQLHTKSCFFLPAGSGSFRVTWTKSIAARRLFVFAKKKVV